MTTTNPTTTLTEWERLEIQRANDSGLKPVVFVHGLWLLSSSWQPWRDLFEAAGYTTIAPGWPDDPGSISEARDNPEAFAHKMVLQVRDHYVEAISALSTRPAVIGHSFGGLIAQQLAGLGVSDATVSIDNAPFKGVLPLPASSLKSSAPVLGNPANFRHAVSLTFEQFQYGWANNLDEQEARHLYETFHVPASGAPLFQAAVANLNPFGGDTRVDHERQDRGPLLVIGGANDNTVPLAITKASYKIQSGNTGITEFAEIAGRGHSLTIDSGWREVAGVALEFVQRFA
jgi:non-heme chloroperoxidase